MGSSQEYIKEAFYSLQEIKKEIDKCAVTIEGFLVDGYKEFLDETSKKIDGLRPFNPDHYHYYRDPNTSSRYFNADGIKVNVNWNFGILKSKFETANDQQNVPFIATPDFSFINNRKLQNIAKRDFKELQLAWISKSWKSVIILSGSLLENVLLDALLAEAEQAKTSSSAPKNKNQLEDWNLSELIAVANELDKIAVGVDKLSHSLREYRNLVHPGKEVSSGLTVKPEEATIAYNVLMMVLRKFGFSKD